jgi:hypothetical protein
MAMFITTHIHTYYPLRLKIPQQQIINKQATNQDTKPCVLKTDSNIKFLITLFLAIQV